MAEPFLGEIRVFSFAFAPKGWAQCNGQTLPINQNQALFSLLGTTFGGNGVTTFMLPNAQNRCFLGFNGTYPLGAAAGETAHTLIDQEIPSHTHIVSVSNQAGTAATPSGNFYANTGTEKLYVTSAPSNSAVALLPVGGSQPHNNQQPSLVLNFCIALQGIFPSRN